MKRIWKRMCIYIHIYMSYFAIQQQSTQHYKSTVLQLKKRIGFEMQVVRGEQPSGWMWKWSWQPLRPSCVSPVPCILEVSGPRVHCKEHLSKDCGSELGSNRENRDKSKKPKRTPVLSISIGLFVIIWRSSLLQFYSSDVVVPRIGIISTI